jgi:hypothetical protein
MAEAAGISDNLYYVTAITERARAPNDCCTVERINSYWMYEVRLYG